MIEFSVVLPLILVLLVGTVNLGSLVSQLAWMSQTGYEMLILGSDYETDNERSIPLQTRAMQMSDWNHQLSKHTDRVGILVPDPDSDITEYNSGGTNLISVRLGASLPTLIGPIKSVPIGVSMVGPILALPQVNNSSFSNPGNCRNCGGVEGSGCNALNTDPCLVCQDDGTCTCQNGSVCG